MAALMTMTPTQIRRPALRAVRRRPMFHGRSTNAMTAWVSGDADVPIVPSDVLELQRTAGNRAVAALVGSRSADSARPMVQRKWSLGDTEDQKSLYGVRDKAAVGPATGQVAQGTLVAVDPELDTRYDRAPALGLPAGFWANTVSANGWTTKDKIKVHSTLEEALLNSIRWALVNAENVHPVLAGKLSTDKNAAKLLKPFRLDKVNPDPESFKHWISWKNNVNRHIEREAKFVAQQLLHWRFAQFGADNKVGFEEVDIEGSDLHDRGLGAMIVTFSKKDKSGRDKFVIKPEDRALEQAMFGSESTSMANQLNRLAKLGKDSAIATFLMKTHAQYGSLIEFCQGTQARDIAGAGKKSDGLWEAMALTMIAGLSDAHQDNVFWLKSGVPVFIDADNALNWHRMNLKAPPGHERQTGFTNFMRGETDAALQHLQDVMDDPQQADPSKSLLLKKLVDDAPSIVAILRNTFQGKEGRAVPLMTRVWGQALNRAAGVPVGQATDQPTRPATGDGPYTGADSRWAIANRSATWVADGIPLNPIESPGLVLEAGTGPAGRDFKRSEETTQIQADLTDGKIPFYHYKFDTGEVIHNGQVVWRGQPLADVLINLLYRFKKP